MNKRIIWKKWINPFFDDTKESTEDFENFKREWKDSYEELEEKTNKQEKAQQAGNNVGPVLVGPMGIIPLVEHNRADKVYNLWIMHTNFSITDKIKNLLCEIDGVETLDIFTRYRVRVGFGEAFDAYEVQDKIQEVLCKVEQAQAEQKATGNILPSLPANINVLKKQAEKKYKFWAIVVHQDNKVQLIGSDTKEEVENALQKIEISKCVFNSWS